MSAVIGKYLTELLSGREEGRIRPSSVHLILNPLTPMSFQSHLSPPFSSLRHISTPGIFKSYLTMSRTKPPLPDDPSPCPLPTPTSTSSFWHSEPSALLTAHRSTRDLPKEADVVIVGSGMTGASVAHHLLNGDRSSGSGQSGSPEGRKKLNVVMLEAREACWGATGRVSPHLSPQPSLGFATHHSPPSRTAATANRSSSNIPRIPPSQPSSSQISTPSTT